MTTDDVLISLSEYNHNERIAKKYYESNGKYLNHLHLAFLESHTDSPNLYDKFENIDSDTGIINFQNLLRNTKVKGLSEKDFFPEGKNLIVEKLLRYYDIPPHSHEFMEIVCVIAGRCVHSIEQQAYDLEAGDVTIIPPGVMHHLIASPDCVCLTVKMKYSTFTSDFDNLLSSDSIISTYFSQTISLPYYRSAVTLHCGNDDYFMRSLLQIYMQQEDNKIYSDMIIKHMWIALFTYLAQNYSDTIEFIRTDALQQEKTIEILNYILENYAQITLSELARHFKYSVSYMSKLIKIQTGMKYTDLIQHYRLSKAESLLKTSDMSISEICYEVGYQNESQFIRLFKATYKNTPMKYRNLFRQSSREM